MLPPFILSYHLRWEGFNVLLLPVLVIFQLIQTLAVNFHFLLSTLSCNASDIRILSGLPTKFESWNNALPKVYWKLCLFLVIFLSSLYCLTSIHFFKSGFCMLPFNHQSISLFFLKQFFLPLLLTSIYKMGYTATQNLNFKEKFPYTSHRLLKSNLMFSKDSCFNLHTCSHTHFFIPQASKLPSLILVSLIVSSLVVNYSLYWKTHLLFLCLSDYYTFELRFFFLPLFSNLHF